MHTGMIWSDNTAGVPFASRLERAASYYLRKYHRLPTLCLVHPSMLDLAEGQFGKVTVRAYPSVLPGHFWIGVEDGPRTRSPRA